MGIQLAQFVIGGAVAAGMAATTAIGDDWSFSSERNGRDSLCFAQPGGQIGANRARLLLDQAGLAVSVDNDGWNLDVGTAFRSAIAFDDDPEESALADVVTPTMFRVLLSEATDGETRAREARRIAVKRGAGGDAAYYILTSGSFAYAISRLQDCLTQLENAPSISAEGAGSMTSDMADYIETVMGEDMEVQASNSEAMLLESKSYTVYMNRRASGVRASDARMLISDLLDETFPDCDIPAEQRDSAGLILVGVQPSASGHWTASGTFSCLGKNLCVSAAGGDAFFNLSVAINHGRRLKAEDTLRKLEIASLLQ